MATRDHTKLLIEGGVREWNRWRNSTSARPDLRGADLRGMNLNKASFQKTQLSHANFTGAHLKGANFSGASLYSSIFKQSHLNGAMFNDAIIADTDFQGADLTDGHFFGANITYTNMEGVSLNEAELQLAHFHHVNMLGTTFYHSRMGQTCFGSVDLSEAIGLETVVHWRPSLISIDSIYRSQGKIPYVFLKKTGMPDEMIAKVLNLSIGNVRLNSCFISYSSGDSEFAAKLHSDLQELGVRCWFAPAQVRAGRKIYDQIHRAIREYDKLLLILSKNSMSSEWVKTEIYEARQAEIRERRRILFPIGLVRYGEIRKWKAFDADTGKDLAREIREYFIPDFSNWRSPGAYKKALSKLAQDLEKED